MRADINISEFQDYRSGKAGHLDGHDISFDMGYVLNKKRTEEENRPIHDDVPFLHLVNFAGEKTSRVAEERDKRAYPEIWARAEKKWAEPTSGTNLKEWCLLSKAKLADLEAFGLRTVEQVAGLTEDIIKQYPSLKEFQRLAENWLGSAKTKQAEVTNLKEQLHKLDGRFKKLEELYFSALRRIEANEGNRLSDAY